MRVSAEDKGFLILFSHTASSAALFLNVAQAAVEKPSKTSLLFSRPSPIATYFHLTITKSSLPARVGWDPASISVN